MGKVIAVANQKGGVGKTTTTVNLGIALARAGKKVLLIDADAQGNLSMCLGIKNPDELPVTLSSELRDYLEGKPYDIRNIIFENEEGVDFVPCNIELSALEIPIFSATRREYIFETLLSGIKDEYEYILIDCSPSLGMLTVNAFTVADSVLIPVQAEYLSAKGLEHLLQTIDMVKTNLLNPSLDVEGVLMTMIDARTTINREVISAVEKEYEDVINIFKTRVPKSVKATECSVVGKSIFSYSPRSKAAKAYSELAKEVLLDG